MIFRFFTTVRDTRFRDTDGIPKTRFSTLISGRISDLEHFTALKMRSFPQIAFRRREQPD